MADIDFYSDSNDDSPEDGYGLDDSLDSDDIYNTDDKLTPLQKLEKYMQSDNVYTRQMVARGLLDTLRAVEEAEEDVTPVLNAMVRLSEDSDPIVRSELMEQVPHLAVYCQDNIDLYENAVPSYILPMVVRYLNDPNNQVRKTSQAALLVLLEQKLIGCDDIERQVVGVILDLASPDSLDDYRTEAVALMSKMAPLLGNEMTERLFLPRYCEMCTDPLFHVRKVCAANFGDLCTVVGQDSTEKQLLPKFYYLCEDGVWGVRKACAECFMAVSCSCSPDTRRGDLANLFVNLLCDLSRWVRMAAFQQLGPFISTFADPGLTGLYVSDDGILCVRNPEQLQTLENFERLKEIGEKLENESKQLKESGVCAEECDDEDDISNVLSEKSSYDNSKTCDTVSDTVEPMDLTDDNKEGDILVSSDDVMGEDQDIDISVEEKRAELYQKNNERETEACDDKEVENMEDLQKGEEVNSENSDSASEKSCDTERNSSNKPTGDSVESCSDSQDNSQTTEVNDLNEPERETNTCDNQSIETNESNIEHNSDNNQSKTPSSAKDLDVVHIHLDSSSTKEFSSFNFWRNPLPEVDVDFDIVNGQPTNFHVKAKVKDDLHRVFSTEMNVSLPVKSQGEKSAELPDDLASLSLDRLTSDSDVTVLGSGEKVVEESGIQIHTASISTVMEDGETVNNIGSTHVLGQNLNETTMSIIDGVVQDYELGYIDSNLLLSLLPLTDISGSSLGYIDSDSNQDQNEALDEAILAQQQDIVPQSLLESYLGMVDPARAQTVDAEITRHCAYNLPAVAYTLGRRNWNCIKLLYETLAGDMQWKVRRTLAFSIHEMAIILGEEITHRDLVPVFDGFLKDLDEVRIGVLRHLADFLRLLKPSVRAQYLTKVQGFMNTDNQRNWRFRLELAEQLMLISELYSAQEISQYLLPLGLLLAEDKVAEVRIVAFRLISAIVRRMLDDGNEKLTESLMNELVIKFAKSNRWVGRQIFVQLVQTLLEEDTLSMEYFVKDLMPSLLCLSHDPVANVRLTLSKIVSQYLVPSEFFSSDKNPNYEELMKTLHKLQTDSDRDVRFFASPKPEMTSLDYDKEDIAEEIDIETLPV